MNLASRLEGANKQYGSNIMISESTYVQVKDRMIARVLDTITVKGRSLPTKVFELIGHKGDNEVEEMERKLENYYKGLEKYLEKEFQTAIYYFDLSIEILPDDRPSWTYLERSQFYLDNPPDDDWCGVFELKSK